MSDISNDTRRTILVIEDEVVLLSLIAGILEEAGYRVLTAEDGLEAVTVLRKETASIDIVLSDLGIPHLSGRELFRALHEIKPGLKIFATSGFLEPALKSQLKTAGVFDFVDKPYAPDMLLQILDRAFQS